MTCDCNNNNKKYVFCQNCMPSEDTWLVPVEEVPDPFFMDRHHAYITKDNRVYILSEDRTQAKEIGGGNGNVTHSPKLNELEQGLADVENTVHNTHYIKGVRKTDNVVTLDKDYMNMHLVTEKVDAVASTEHYFPSVNDSHVKEYTLTMNPFDSKVVNAHLKIDLNRVRITEGTYEFTIKPKDIVLYVPISIEEGECTYFTQSIEIIEDIMFLEIRIIAKLTPTKMFLIPIGHIVVKQDHQTVYRGRVYPIGDQIHIPHEISHKLMIGYGPENKVIVSYDTQEVPYVGLILTRLKTFK